MATFALIADPHITVPNPETGWVAPAIPNEPTLYHESVELLEAAIAEINAIPDVEFVLVAGDLTRDSEPYNHHRARELLTGFRKPVYCVSGNHDQPRPAALRPRAFLDPDVVPVSTAEIPRLYGDFGFNDTQRTSYSCNPSADVHLIGLCSPKPDEDNGWISPETFSWLQNDLEHHSDPGRETILMLHHSIIDHVPAESINPTFSWFHVENSAELKTLLRQFGVRITLTGHLHIQDVKEEGGVYNIATASIAGYPHAYRIMTLEDGQFTIRSRRLRAIPSQPDLQVFSRAYMEPAFVSVIADVLKMAPFSYDNDQACATAVKLRNWWPAIADGDAQFAFTGDDLGSELLAAYVNSFSDHLPSDNDLVIGLRSNGHRR